ncbi:pyridine nucleotide-disulfide oxidoreductase [Martelella lutilitoris]|uniref:Pyridine nucleotide-disulfide oxidoreductase n=1 Tax=Martelella lutilitoris TaxID=2583532 RepID=A0A5C4JUJ1_9HYPH|nr:FAD-dependent oxidoreductase [Martelella lutilitoris]TNB48289.1 pyridine nucleotide-disulfide oxidoreductase [Martelella lutilitoris]
MSDRIVIVGAGQGGFAVAAKLRALKDERPITLIGAEAVPPYQRPPLSKKYLLGEMAFDRLLFRPETWYGENDVNLLLERFVERIDRDARQVVMQDGSTLPYGTLVLATGAAPRRLPEDLGGDLDGVFVMRDKHDADRLAKAMKPGARLLVVGGGYVGLEAAAVARKFEVEVTVIEMADRILKRVAAAETSEIMRAIHRDHGVDIRENTGLIHLEGEDGHVRRAVLSGGETLEIDMVVVGIGVTPNDQLAKEAGLAVGNGIVVDAFGRTSDPDIFAVGDCVEQPYRGARIRLESVPNAVDQGEAIAAVIAGSDKTYQPEPWFWSDQYDVKLQIAGYNGGYDRVVVREGAREGSKSVWYFKGDTLLAVDAINDARAYVCAKKMLSAGINPSVDVISDPATDLKALANP